MEIEILKHIRSEKFFVLLDDSRVDRYRVVNPAGAKLVMPADQFEDDPYIIELSEAKDKLSPEQYAIAVKEVENEEAQAKLFIAHAEKVASEQHIEKQREKVRSATPTRRKPREKVNTKKGLGATWSSSSLTFYRHHIDPLGPKQSFRIVIDGVGTFEMTREQFQSVFNDVVMENKYRQEGYFSYPSIPEKARRFLKDGDS